MRPKIHGWFAGGVLSAAACLGSLVASEPFERFRATGANPPASAADRPPVHARPAIGTPGSPPSQFVRQNQPPPSAAPVRPPATPGNELMQRPAPPEEGEVPSVLGTVDVQGLDQLGVLILRGSPQDIENMTRIIEKIQEISEAVEPFVRVFQLQRAPATQARETILQLYGGATGRTAGTTGGPAAGAATTTVPGTTTGATTLQVPALKRFQIAADERSNTLIVQASPQMMEELAKLIERLDVDSAPTAAEVKVFHLKNAEATELADILNQAIRGSAAGTTTGAGALGGAAAGGGVTTAGGTSAQAIELAGRSAVLRFVPPDGPEFRAIESGILDSVRITPQIRTNSIVVSAPASSMGLLAAIIQELDRPPTIVASIKVFHLENSDANNLRNTLAELFDIETTTAAGGGAAGGGFGAGATTTQFQRPLAVSEGNQPPVSIRVSVDSRTNSLIVTGPEGTLLAVEAVIKRLDLGDIYNRKTMVYRLKNAQASDVATALTSFYTTKRTVEAQTAAGTTLPIIGAYQRLEQDVVVVALDNALAASLTTVANPTPTATPATQGVNNLLLLSATARYYDEVIKMIEQLDAPQPQVMIQVIIAQLTLSDGFEFGIEFGDQSSVLFNRGISQTGSVTTAVSPSGTTTTTTSQTRTSGETGGASPSLNPGFNFNSSPVPALPNSALANPGQVAGQGLANFALGRISTLTDAAGASGLLLAASSRNISALLRTLEINGHLEIISRPQIMTLDGRTAQVLVGEQFPYVGAVNVTTNAIIPTVSFTNIGISLSVKPSITPDDRIYLEVVPTISELKQLVNVQQTSTTTGTLNQQAPDITITTANTVVGVNDGQTIVLGGMIQKRNTGFVRKIPWLGDLPHLGFLFRFTQEQEQKQELLIIMTPHIVRTPADSQRIKDLELARVNWIMDDACELHEDFGFGGDGAVEIIAPPAVAPDTTGSAPPFGTTPQAAEPAAVQAAAVVQAAAAVQAPPAPASGAPQRVAAAPATAPRRRPTFAEKLGIRHRSAEDDTRR
jgi:general secretion pathway protein D